MSSFTHPYARAFVECAPTGYDFAVFLAAGESIAAAMAGNPKLRAFFQTPSVAREAKGKALAALSARAGFDAYGSRFLQVLLKNHRLLEAGEVFKAIRDAHDALQGIVRARITVASPIAEDEKKLVEEAIASRTGKKVRLQVVEDPAILAGFVARVGSNVFDGSAVAEIRRFQEQVKQRTGV